MLNPLKTGTGGIGSNVENMLEGAELVGDAVGLLLERPSLLLYPLVGALVSIVVGLFGIAGLYVVWVTIGIDSLPVFALAVFAVLFVTYLLVAYVNTLFTAALVHEVYDYHHDIDLSIVAGVRAAASNWWPLFLWAAINWTIGRLFKRSRRNNNRRRRGGRLMGEAISTGWTAATFFVIPVILFEDARGRDMLQKSAGHFKESWGQILGAVLGLRVLGWVLGSAGAALGGLFFLGELAILALPIVVVFGVVASVVTLSLQGVIKGTVYEHLTADDHDVADVVPSERPAEERRDTAEVA